MSELPGQDGSSRHGPVHGDPHVVDVDVEMKAGVAIAHALET